MIVIGLTGSIGMGKSSTAAMFRDEGIPVHDSDAAVHHLYRGPAVPQISAKFPSAIENGSVNRNRLGIEVIGNPEKMKLLESIVHPLVGQMRDDFIADSRRRQARIAVVDIPLLFEIGGEKDVDIIAVCSAPDRIQESRVLARPGMTREKFESIRAKQVDNVEKRRRAHVVIDTGAGFDYARSQVRYIIRALSSTC